MNILYYYLLLIRKQNRLSADMLRGMYVFLFFCCPLFVGHSVMAQYGSDLGKQAVSTLAWKQIASYGSDASTGASIGLTTNNKIYTWGDNVYYTIHTQSWGPSTQLRAQYQVTPSYVPAPAGETPKIVRIKYNDKTFNEASGSQDGATYFCLTESGKLYAWGINWGFASTAWPAVTALPAAGDTTKTRRRPVLVPTPENFVDFDIAKTRNMEIGIGTSGKAYVLGVTGAATLTTFTAMPNPAGVDNSTFKYTRVWLGKGNRLAVYLKGNDGKIYYTGYYNSSYATGIPANFGVSQSSSNLVTQVPVEVPFPAGEEILEINVNNIDGYSTTYAFSATGKGYMTGFWRFSKASTYNNQYWVSSGQPFVVTPLKGVPNAGDIGMVGADSAFLAKKFLEVATPPGASKIVWIERFGNQALSTSGASIIIGDNYKAFWSGNNDNVGLYALFSGNYLSLDVAEGRTRSDYAPNALSWCSDVDLAHSTSRYAWKYEAVNFSGATMLVNPSYNTNTTTQQINIISTTGRGYFMGFLSPNCGFGKVGQTGVNYWFPTPIANELLHDCNASPGIGGPLTDTPATSGTATIDCSKTQLAPAPVSGTPGQAGLIITMTVSATGSFPLTISGSGMSLANGVTSVIAKSTGTQQFYIPLLYDGSTLGTLNFTVGTATNAGSCSADLTKSPKQTITNVWTLDCVPTVGPGLR